MQQIGYRPERTRRACLTRCGGIQVGPGRWNERPRTIRQDQNEIQLAAAAHPAVQRERLPFQGVAGSNDGDRRRIALEMGSVLPFRSTRWTTRNSGTFCTVGCVMAWSCD
jgi:hypothetical protein